MTNLEFAEIQLYGVKVHNRKHVTVMRATRVLGGGNRRIYRLGAARDKAGIQPDDYVILLERRAEDLLWGNGDRFTEQDWRTTRKTRIQAETTESTHY